jgi:hypothetical protein
VIVGDTAIRAAFRQPRAVSRMTAVNLAGNVARPEEAVYLYPGAASTQPAFKLVVHDGHMTLLRNDSGTWTKVANALHRKGQTWGLLDQELNGLHDPHAQLERDPTAPPRRHR